MMDYSSRSLERGLLLRKDTYTANNQLIHSTLYTYDTLSINKDNYRVIGSNIKFGSTIFSCGMAQAYATFHYPINLIQEENITYTQEGNISQKINYFYDGLHNTYHPHNFITQEKIWNGEKIITKKYKRPLDYFQNTSTITGSNGIALLVNKHIYTPIIEQTEYISDDTVQLYMYKGTITEYEQQDSLVLPKSIYESQLTSPKQGYQSSQIVNNQLEFDSTCFRQTIWYKLYGKYGTLLEYTKNDKLPISILWGFDHTYPIAHIKGSTYLNIMNAFGGSNGSAIWKEHANTYIYPTVMEKVQTLRTQFHSAQVTTYTYKPLVGMTSQTDPRGITTYYGYDNYGRLIEKYIIENGEKKILQKYDYHYSHTVE